MAKEGPGYIYIISLAPMGLPGYKIGETTNLTRRLKQLKVPSHATRVHTFKVQKRLAAEKAAHQLYPNLRVPQSEWFKISEQQMERVASFIRNRFTAEQVKHKVVTAQWPPADLDSSYPSSSFKPASERCMALEQPKPVQTQKLSKMSSYVGSAIICIAMIPWLTLGFVAIKAGINSALPNNAPTTNRLLQ